MCFQGGSLSVHPDDMKLLQNHPLLEQSETDATPPVPPQDLADTIDGKFRLMYIFPLTLFHFLLITLMCMLRETFFVNYVSMY